MMILIATVVEMLAMSKDVSGLSSTILAAIGLESGSNVVMMVVLETVLLIGFTVVLFKYRRAWIRMRECVREKVYCYVSCEEMITVIDNPCVSDEQVNVSETQQGFWAGLLQDLSYA